MFLFYNSTLYGVTCWGRFDYRTSPPLVVQGTSGSKSLVPVQRAGGGPASGSGSKSLVPVKCAGGGPADDSNSMNLVPVWCSGGRLRAVPLNHMVGSAVSLVGSADSSLERRMVCLLSDSEARATQETATSMDPLVFANLVFAGRDTAHTKKRGLVGPYRQLQPLVDRPPHSAATINKKITATK